MKRIISLLTVAIAAVLLLPSMALAAKPAAGGSTKPSASTPELVGYDVSHPQCGRKLPTDHYFAIIGVNGGTATSYNTCLTDQLVWAKGGKTGSDQPKVQLYVNTANPAQEATYSWSSWPTSGDTPYGICAGEKTNDEACSWQYGWNRSVETAAYAMRKAQAAGLSANVGDYAWWLDVETMNSWQKGDGLARNKAAIEGFAAYYQSKSETVGLYSTKSQWEQIVGTTLITEGNLYGLPNWRPSGSSLANAKANCTVAPLTAGGFISMTQYVQQNLDKNHSCL